MVPRTERGLLRHWGAKLLAAGVRAALSSGLLSVLLSLLDLRNAILPLLGAFVFASGLMYLGRALAHRADPSYANPEVADLVSSDLNFGYSWVAFGLLLILLGLWIRLPVAVPFIGATICWGLYMHGWTAGDKMVRREKRLRIAGGSKWVEETDPVRLIRRRSKTGPLLLGARHLPKAFGRKRPRGQLSLFLSITLLFVGYTGLAYGGIAAVDLLRDAVGHHGSAGRDRLDDEASTGKEDAPSSDSTQPSYADLCPQLPDPQDIEMELGDLFEYDGAVAAGCGQPAIEVGTSTWVSPGYCGPELRSLAVVGEGRDPVLLYGTPARFAWEKGLDGELLYAEAKDPAGGEVVLVATGRGSFTFTRSSPTLDRGSEIAVRCQDVDEVPRPFAELPPPLTYLWVERMNEMQAWAWPEPVSGSDQIEISSPSGGSVYGSCDGDFRCQLGGPTDIPPSEATALVTLADMPYMPNPLPSDP